jgi:peroxiredoxin/YHS domain-containing protein
MKALIAGLTASLLFAGGAFAQDGPVNTNCPVKGKPAKSNITTEHDGKQVAFCCFLCKRKFEKNPETYAANIKGGTSKASTDKAVVGQRAPNFTLKDTGGEEVSLSDFAGKMIVLQWINKDCPVCRRVMEKGLTAKMLGDLKGLDGNFVWLAIDTTHYMKAADTAAYLKKHGMSGKGLMDPTGKVGRMYGAKTTPHLYVIDTKGVLRYSGALNDDRRGRMGTDATNYAVNAVKQIVAGEEVSPSSTRPYGCSVKYNKKASP